MHKMMYINDVKHLCERDGVFYFVRRVPVDVLPYYSSKRISISLKTKSASAAIRASKSINQRLEDYWLGLRLQNMDIPAIQVVKPSNSVIDDGLLLSEACELYLRLEDQWSRSWIWKWVSIGGLREVDEKHLVVV